MIICNLLENIERNIDGEKMPPLLTPYFEEGRSGHHYEALCPSYGIRPS